MSQQPINICSLCSVPMSLVNFDIYICYTCAAKSEKEMTDEEFFDKHPQPKEIQRIIYSENRFDLLNSPEMIRCTAIDNCRDDYIVLKKNDDLYVYKNLDSHEIRSSITFEVVPNYRYNETTGWIEKIDPSIEEEDRRLIVLQKNPKAILFEEYEKTRDKILENLSRK